MIFKSSRFYLMRCSGCMYAEVSPISPVPCIYFYPICHRSRLRVKCHKGYNPATVPLNSLYGQVSFPHEQSISPTLPHRIHFKWSLSEKSSEFIFTHTPLCFQNISVISQLLLPLLRSIHSSRSSDSSKQISTLKNSGAHRKKNAVNITVPL